MLLALSQQLLRNFGGGVGEDVMNRNTGEFLEYHHRDNFSAMFSSCSVSRGQGLGLSVRGVTQHRWGKGNLEYSSDLKWHIRNKQESATRRENNLVQASTVYQ